MKKFKTKPIAFFISIIIIIESPMVFIIGSNEGSIRLLGFWLSILILSVLIEPLFKNKKPNKQ